MAINVINLNNGKKKKLKINDYIWAMQINSTQCEINETNKPKKKSSPSLLRLSSGLCDYYFFWEFLLFNRPEIEGRHVYVLIFPVVSH